MLFFARHASLSSQSKTFCQFWLVDHRYHFECDAPDYPTLPITARSRAAKFGLRAGLSLAALPESHLALTSVGQGFGLPLRSVSAARNTYTTILELPLQR